MTPSLGSIFGGGRGGGSGHGSGGGMGGRGAGTSEAQREVQTLATEVRDIPQHLTIAASAATVTITPDDSSPRVFAIRNIKEKVDLVLAQADVTSAWNGASLVQNFDAGSPMKLAVTYTPSADGKALTVTMVVTRPKNQGGEAKPTIRIYDRAQYVARRADAAGHSHLSAERSQ